MYLKLILILTMLLSHSLLKHDLFVVQKKKVKLYFFRKRRESTNNKFILLSTIKFLYLNIKNFINQIKIYNFCRYSYIYIEYIYSTEKPLKYTPFFIKNITMSEVESNTNTNGKVTTNNCLHQTLIYKYFNIFFALFFKEALSGRF